MNKAIAMSIAIALFQSVAQDNLPHLPLLINFSPVSFLLQVDQFPHALLPENVVAAPNSLLKSQPVARTSGSEVRGFLRVELPVEFWHPAAVPGKAPPQSINVNLTH